VVKPNLEIPLPSPKSRTGHKITVKKIPQTVDIFYSFTNSGSPSRAAEQREEIMSVDIKTNVSVKRKIVVNGHEYGNVEELPGDLRQAYDRAMSAMPGSSKVKIVFNGKEYESKDEMPSDVRRIYEGAIAATKMRFSFQEWKSDQKTPISPAGGKDAFGKVGASASGARWFILGLGILLGFTALYFLSIK